MDKTFVRPRLKKKYRLCIFCTINNFSVLSMKLAKLKVSLHCFYPSVTSWWVATSWCHFHNLWGHFTRQICLKSLKLEKFLISRMDSHILRSTLFKKNFIKRFLSEQFGIQFDDKVFTFCKCLNSGPKERGFLCAIT